MEDSDKKIEIGSQNEILKRGNPAVGEINKLPLTTEIWSNMSMGWFQKRYNICCNTWCPNKKVDSHKELEIESQK